MTIKMKYKEFIENILNTRGRFNINGVKYRHHIVPRCMKGSDDEENLIDLTRTEHLEAHLLLALENPKNVRLQEAYRQMARVWSKYTTPEQKQFLDSMPPQIPWNKGIKYNDELKERVSIGTKRAMEDPKIREKCGNGQRGKHRSEDVKHRISNTEKGRIRSKEEIEKMIETKKQRRIQDPTYTQKLSTCKLGEKNPMYGKVPHNAIPLLDVTTGVIYNSKTEALQKLKIDGKELKNRLSRKELVVYENKNN